MMRGGRTGIVAGQHACSVRQGRTRRSAGIFHASPILWIIATVSARRRNRTSEARELARRSSLRRAPRIEKIFARGYLVVT